MLSLSNILTLERCPHCNIDKPNLPRLWTGPTSDFKDTNRRQWATYVCQRCGGVVTACSQEKKDQVIDFFPKSAAIDQSIPERAKVFLRQAMDSLHSPSGAVMLAASAVDAMLKAKDYKQGSLYSRIDQSAADHVITPEMAKWAHQVRLDANDQRHADDDAQLPGPKDAQQAVEFALAFAQYLFVLPSRISKGIEQSQEGVAG
jgi:hypothetical protein